jgi:hypothetical protein
VLGLESLIVGIDRYPRENALGNIRNDSSLHPVFRGPLITFDPFTLHTVESVVTHNISTVNILVLCLKTFLWYFAKPLVSECSAVKNVSHHL